MADDPTRSALGALPPPPRLARRLVYLGTPAAAVPPLEALVAAGFDVALVVTRPDKRRGRRAEASPSPVKAAAQALGIPVTTDVAEAAGVGADLGVVVAFGQILRAELLSQLPMVNVHFSLLPRWRGAAPVERAILAGDARTGVAVMGVAEGLDEGPVYAEVAVDIDPAETADELRARLVAAGSSLLVDTLRSGLDAPVPQEGEVTYAAKITPADLELDWTLPATDLDRRVRVGGAWTTWRGERCKVWRAHVADVEVDGPPGAIAGTAVRTGAGALALVEVQPAGKARLDAEAWLRGARPGPDERFGA
ncbi:MAG: hypothetical protein KDB35_11965 [Acidimicrobiales bacterium]|nr:hypothetical protein [Acidimicrobiales bacterium]MCB1251502.1 hypothetical protein [Acidimicrobiales bacterium]